jgi:hypothetical protein
MSRACQSYTVDAAISALDRLGKYQSVGVIGGDATLKLSIYQTKLLTQGCKCVTPSEAELSCLVMPAIRLAKRSDLRGAGGDAAGDPDEVGDQGDDELEVVDPSADKLLDQLLYWGVLARELSPNCPAVRCPSALKLAVAQMTWKERGGPTGKLYAQPFERCPCGAPVLEYFTCRHCGTSYARAYTTDVTNPQLRLGRTR